VLDSAAFGVPQSRRRLFILCDREREPDEVAVPSHIEQFKAAGTILTSNGAYPFVPLRTKRRAVRTLQSAERAIQALGTDSSFLIVYYGSDGGGGWQALDVPLRTVTTLDRFALVRPTRNGHEMRMLQVPELRKAMGLPASFKLKHGTRRDQIKMIGNGVCPPVMRAVVSALTRTGLE
jgi:DNA (cytosine-5)-methyltransferase 1